MKEVAVVALVVRGARVFVRSDGLQYVISEECAALCTAADRHRLTAGRGAPCERRGAAGVLSKRVMRRLWRRVGLFAAAVPPLVCSLVGTASLACSSDWTFSLAGDERVAVWVLPPPLVCPSVEAVCAVGGALSSAGDPPGEGASFSPAPPSIFGGGAAPFVSSAGDPPGKGASFSPAPPSILGEGAASSAFPFSVGMGEAFLGTPSGPFLGTPSGPFLGSARLSLNAAWCSVWLHVLRHASTVPYARREAFTAASRRATVHPFLSHSFKASLAASHSHAGSSHAERSAASLNLSHVDVQVASMVCAVSGGGGGARWAEGKSRVY